MDPKAPTFSISADAVAIRALGHREQSLSSASDDIVLEPIAGLLIRGDDLTRVFQRVTLMPTLLDSPGLPSVIHSAFCETNLYALAWDPALFAERISRDLPLTIEFVTYASTSIQVECTSSLQGTRQIHIDTHDPGVVPPTALLTIEMGGSARAQRPLDVRLEPLQRERPPRRSEFQGGTTTVSSVPYRKSHYVSATAKQVEFISVPLQEAYTVSATSEDGRCGRMTFTHDGRPITLILQAGRALIGRLVDESNNPIRSDLEVMMTAAFSNPGNPSTATNTAPSEPFSRSIALDPGTGAFRFPLNAALSLEQGAIPDSPQGTLTIDHPAYAIRTIELGPLTVGDTDLGMISLRGSLHYLDLRSDAGIDPDRPQTDEVLMVPVGDRTSSFEICSSKPIDAATERLSLSVRALDDTQLRDLFIHGALNSPACAVVTRTGEFRFLEQIGDGCFREVESSLMKLSISRSESADPRDGFLEFCWRGIRSGAIHVAFDRGEARASATFCVPSDAFDFWWTEVDRMMVERTQRLTSIPIAPGARSISLP